MNLKLHRKDFGHEKFCEFNPNRDKYLKQAKEAFHKASIIANSKKKERAAQDPLNQIKTYDLTCQKCGNSYQLEIKVRDFLNDNYRKTCSSKCAHQRILSEETKEKIKAGINKALNKERTHSCIKCGNEYISSSFQDGICDNCRKKEKLPPKRIKNLIKKQIISSISIHKPDYFKKHNIGLHKVICENCGKEIYAKDDRCKYCADCADELNEWKFQTYSADGKKLFSKKHCEKLSERTKKLMKEGKIKPWQSRNISSYAEKFFMKVLDFNKIEYEREHYVPEHGYFLDFFIIRNGKKIDFEVDGKQHWVDKERMQHDIERDENLKSLRI